MRTTFKLDDDVAVLLKSEQDRRKTSVRSLVNEAIRVYLANQQQSPKKRKRYRLRPLKTGTCLVGNLDNVAEVLAVAEGESFK
jgi:hypothetical protein